MKKITSILLMAACMLTACGSTGNVPDARVRADADSASESTATSVEEEAAMTYEQIDQKTAYELMQSKDCIVLDVRRQDEFDEKHIPGAICIPVETITDAEPAGLPDKEQLILVYCRSGRRSKIASESLAAMGYSNIKEFGGIIDWEYETVSSENGT